MGPPTELVEFLKAEFGLKTFIESGTFQGSTTRWAAENFKNVVTIEAGEEFYLRAKSRSLGEFKNVQ